MQHTVGSGGTGCYSPGTALTLPSRLSGSNPSNKSEGGLSIKVANANALPCSAFAYSNISYLKI